MRWYAMRACCTSKGTCATLPSKLVHLICLNICRRKHANTWCLVSIATARTLECAPAFSSIYRTEYMHNVKYFRRCDFRFPGILLCGNVMHKPCDCESSRVLAHIAMSRESNLCVWRYACRPSLLAACARSHVPLMSKSVAHTHI